MSSASRRRRRRPVRRGRRSDEAGRGGGRGDRARSARPDGRGALRATRGTAGPWPGRRRRPPERSGRPAPPAGGPVSTRKRRTKDSDRHGARGRCGPAAGAAHEGPAQDAAAGRRGADDPRRRARQPPAGGDGGGRRHHRLRRAPQLAAWSASLLAYAIASAALAWGAAAGWDDRAFRVYYLFGGLLTAPLLGVGSLLLVGRRWARPVGLLYTGLAVGIGLAVPLTAPVSGASIPEAQAHLDLLPARLVAIVGNGAGTLAVVAVAVWTFRRRPLGNGLILAGVAVAAAGSAVAGLGEAETAAFVALAAALLYAGFLAASGERTPSPSRRRRRAPRSA